MKIVFIAGPYYGDGKYETIEQNVQDAEKVAIALANRQVPFFCAHLHTRHFEQKAAAPENFYHSLDRAILIRAADGILALPRWKESGGAQREIALADESEIPVFYLANLEDEVVLNMVERWTKSE